MTRTCSGCLKDKPNSSFNERGDGKVQRRCAECKRSYLRDYYLKNKESEKRRLKKNKAIAIQRVSDIAWELRKSPCSDCGKTFLPVAMDFAYIEQSDVRDMSGPLSRSSRGGMSIMSFMQEAAKCEIVCACCNRMREWNRSHPSSPTSQQPE